MIFLRRFALAMLLLMTSTPRALLGENDVPGIPKIFMVVLCLVVDAKIVPFSELFLRQN